MGVTALRKRAHDSAITDLSERVDERAFEAAFGAGKESLSALVDSSTVSIGKLMELAPPGTPDPTPLLYADTMHACAGLLAVGFVANAAVRPVHPRHHMKW